MKITVIGGGYVGLVSAVGLADLGHSVTIVEIDPNKALSLNQERIPIYETGLDHLLHQHIRKTLHVDSDYNSVPDADCILICVGTPSRPDGSVDLTWIESASRMIGSALTVSTKYCVVIVKSTVPPGTTKNTVEPIILETSGRMREDIGFAMNPEFLREGRAVDDFLHPDRIVIGSDDSRAAERVASLYQGITAPIIQTPIATAEMIKYTSNAFLATKISFSNEIGNICKELGIDVYEVMRGVGSDPRIGPLFLNAGAGFGGSCFPKDVAGLIAVAKETGIPPVLLQAVLEINERQPHRMISLLEAKIGSVADKRIAILGLAFKDNTDDIRDSRAIPVIHELLQKGAEVVAYDPKAARNMQLLFPGITYTPAAADALDGADACLVMTEWPEFSSLDKEFDRMKHRVIIEGRRILRCRDVEGICW